MFLNITVSNQWSAANTTGHAPCAREGHAAAVIGTRMYIFGGCGKLNDGSDDSYFNDLYYLETGNIFVSFSSCLFAVNCS
jgi:N-acetylneuraminic acid mutarotase